MTDVDQRFSLIFVYIVFVRATQLFGENLNHKLSMFSSYRSQSVDFQCKLIGWFLCEGKFVANGLIFTHWYYSRYFLNPEAVSKHLFCSVCQEVFKDPQRAPCGHSFCKQVRLKACVIVFLKLFSIFHYIGFLA